MAALDEQINRRSSIARARDLRRTNADRASQRAKALFSDCPLAACSNVARPRPVSWTHLQVEWQRTEWCYGLQPD